MTRLTFDLEPNELERFRSILAELGLVSTRGPRTGEGSPQRLAEALVSGEVLLVRNPHAKRDASNGAN